MGKKMRISRKKRKENWRMPLKKERQKAASKRKKLVRTKRKQNTGEDNTMWYFKLRRDMIGWNEWEKSVCSLFVIFDIRTRWKFPTLATLSKCSNKTEKWKIETHNGISMTMSQSSSYGRTWRSEESVHCTLYNNYGLTSIKQKHFQVNMPDQLNTKIT